MTAMEGRVGAQLHGGCEERERKKRGRGGEGRGRGRGRERERERERLYLNICVHNSHNELSHRRTSWHS